MSDKTTTARQDAICVLIAPDSFKESISAADAAEAIERGLTRGIGSALSLRCIRVPVADGGEGTLDALTAPEQRRTLTVTGTGGKKVGACYGITDGGETAVIETAKAAGLTLVPENERSALTATTYGVGELIADALDSGCRKLLLTVGGSGTNDGGCGMLAALGADFRDENGRSFIPTGGTLSEIASIGLERLDPRLASVGITIATDVGNPLTGPAGATFVYGRQKGADEAALAKMEAGMLRYSSLLARVSGSDVSLLPGCGAGGGIAAPLLAFTKAEIKSGIDAVLDAAGFERMLGEADMVITGEGKLDAQSLCGKAVSGVARAANKRGVPVYALVGCIGDDPALLLSMGLREITAISDLAPSAAYSMHHAAELLEKAAFILGGQIAARSGRR